MERAKRSWSVEDVAHLTDARRAGVSVAVIAATLNRTETGILMACSELKLPPVPELATSRIARGSTGIPVYGDASPSPTISTTKHTQGEG